MSVKCGNHGRDGDVYHDTPAQVRECFAAGEAAVGKLIEAFQAERVEVVHLDPVAEDRAMKATFAEREREQEEAAAWAGLDPQTSFADEIAQTPTVVAHSGKPSTPGQHKYIQDLTVRLGGDPAAVDLTVLDYDTASATITELSARVKAGRTAVRPDQEHLPVCTEGKHACGQRHAPEGVYKVDDRIYKVVHAVHGSGNAYAKVLVGRSTGEYDEDGNEKKAWSFEMASGAINKLKVEDALSQEEAKQFGILYGICIRCAADLTREESIHVGYGKTCAGHEGWWYPTKVELRNLVLAAQVVEEASAVGS